MLGLLDLGKALLQKGASKLGSNFIINTIDDAVGAAVYRVEGAVNSRIVIGQNGQVIVQGEKTLFLNFGSEARANEFLAKRLGQGMTDAQIKSFQVTQSFLDDLIKSAVPESMAKQFPNSPIVVDITKAANQFGLRGEWLQRIQDAIIQGSGK
jgi:filamentous hemagglutinin